MNNAMIEEAAIHKPQRRIKRWVLLVVMILTGMLIVGLLVVRSQDWPQHEEFDKLFEAPRPFPEFLIGVAPYPGSNYPADPLSHIYWSAIEEEHKGPICVAIDARIIDPEIEYDFDVVNAMADRTLPTDVIELRLFSPMEAEIDLIIQFSSPVTKPSFEVPEPVRAFSAPLHTCWRTQLSPGPYIAQVKITALDGQQHEYSWAFMVSGSNFEE